MVLGFDTILITLPLVVGECCFFGSMHADSISNMKMTGKAVLILHSLQLQAQVTLASLCWCCSSEECMESCTCRSVCKVRAFEVPVFVILHSRGLWVLWDWYWSCHAEWWSVCGCNHAIQSTGCLTWKFMLVGYMRSGKKRSLIRLSLLKNYWIQSCSWQSSPYWL